MWRIRRVLSTVTAMVVAVVGLTVAPASAANGEGSFVSKINSERAARGLDPVEVYWDLVDDARAHSRAMEREDRLYHNPNLGSVTSGWQALGENVGVGPSVSSLHQAFMDSSGHRANILGDYNYVGVGVVKESDTKMWVTVVFMRGPEGLVTPVEEPPAEEPPAEEPPAEEPPAEEPPAEEPPAPSPTNPAPTERPRSSRTAAAAPEAFVAQWTPSGPARGMGRFAPFLT